MAKTAEPPKTKLSRETLREAAKIFKFIRPYRWYLVGGLIVLFISTSMTMVIPYLSGQMIDTSLNKTEESWTLRQIGIIFLATFIIQGIASYFRVYLFAVVSEKGIADVRKSVYQKLIGLPILFFEENHSGELISRLTSDVGKLYSAFSTTIAEFVRQSLTLIVGILLLLFRAPSLSLVMLLIFPAVIVVAILFGRYVRKLSKMRQEELGNSNTVLNEAIQSIQVVKAFTNEFFERVRYGRSIDKVVDISMKYAHTRALFAFVIVFLLFGSLFFILWRGSLLVEAGVMNVGELFEFFLYTIFIGTSVGSLSSFYTEILGALGATERIREILNEKVEIEVGDEAKPHSLKLAGHIEYDKVAFSYPTRPDVQVLKNINFTVPVGQKVALVGASGSGKSTIVQLLLQFYNLQDGTIKVDGKDVRSYDLTLFRENIAIVPQEVILFGGTIKENIAYGKTDATEAEIIAASKKANAYEFIQKFPEGLDTIVGERGIKLSGGQRQRIAIARAILKDPAILLLDEATSSLDAESEKIVQDALNVLMEGRTSIIIAHRLSTIKDVDCIYVLENGEIIESGTHEELSFIEDGAYNNLAKLQFDVVAH